jgi:hypothetical protein
MVMLLLIEIEKVGTKEKWERQKKKSLAMKQPTRAFYFVSEMRFTDYDCCSSPGMGQGFFALPPFPERLRDRSFIL